MDPVYVPEYLEEGWFDPTLTVSGWFSPGFADSPAGPAAPETRDITENIVGVLGIPAAGATNVDGDATLALTATLSASGVVGKVGAATRTVTVTLAATGTVGKVGASTLTETVTLASTGTVGKVAAATLAETVALASTGTVATFGDATTAVTVTLSASGTSSGQVEEETTGGGRGYGPKHDYTPKRPPVVVNHDADASLAARVTTSATGTVGTPAQAALAAAVVLAASGTVGLTGRAYLSVTTHIAETHDRHAMTSDTDLRRLRDDYELLLML